jgi:TonB family protein
MRNEKILVVEFEENSLNSLLESLRTEGFQVVTAKDGHEGLLMFESEKPDLVILEPMLLKLHGFDLCRKISKDTNKKTPVIITTGFYKGEHYKSEAIETFGASAFFEKPYKNEDLMTTIHELLGNGTAESVKDIKKTVQEKKPPSLDIEESVKEMERSIREQKAELEAHVQKTEDFSAKKGKSGIHTQIDDMLQDALSDFGLNLEKKSSEKKAEKKRQPEPEQKPASVTQQVPDTEKTREEKEKQVDEPEEGRELKTEELIEELIQKEEETEEVKFEEEEKTEAVGDEEEDMQEEKKGELAAENQKIFEDYFEEPDKTPVQKNFFGFIKKIKKSLPLMIASTAFVVLIAAGATYYFLKPNKPKSPVSPKRTENISNAQRSMSTLEEQEKVPLSATLDQSGQNEPSGGPILEGAQGNPAENAASDDDIAGPEEEPSSTTEFMSTTGLSSQQRQVLLPEGIPSTESRKFEVIEVEETGEEKLGQTGVEISSPLLDEAVKNILQSENSSDRIKIGDLVPIDTVDIPPVATKKVNPKYPPVAYRSGIEETVVFRALISEFGNVLDVAFMDPTKTAPAFKKACDEAIRQWRFSPAKKGGVNVKVWKTFSIAFKKNKTE